MKKLSEKEKKAALSSLFLHMRQAELAIQGIIDQIDSSDYSSIDRPRRILRLKQVLLSLKIEYNNIKLRYGGNDSQN
jgi:hypothetical protein